MSKTPATWTAFVRSDVYAGACNEDGERPDELTFYVVCENEKGVRFASKKSFTTEELGLSAAEGSAEAFCAAVEKALRAGADPSKSDKWTPTCPAYGSASHDEGLLLEDEARELETEAGVQEADRFRLDHGVGC